MEQTERENFAISLFAVIDRKKVDPSIDLPETFAEHLQMYLLQDLGIECLSLRFLRSEQEVMMVMNGVPEKSLAALLALADIQKTELFRYERDDEERVTLTPIRVNPQ